MNRMRDPAGQPPRQVRPAEPGARLPDDVPPDDAPEFVTDLLGQARTRAAGLQEAVVGAWAEHRGTLQDGRPVRLGASCLLRPCAGDRVLVWSAGSDAWIVAVLERSAEEGPAVLGVDAELAVQAPRITLQAGEVHLAAREFLTSVRNRHAIEDTRTMHSKLRVTDVGTDIRRAVTVDERVAGTFVQRLGTWLSNTGRDARLKARSFLFE